MEFLFRFGVLGLLIAGCSSRSISESDKVHILAELDEINRIDQEYAGIPPEDLLDQYGFEKAWEIFEAKRDSIALINQSKIKDLFDQYGYLGYKEIGEEASGQFWISVQHADNDIEFQQKILQALKREIANENANRNDYAMLEDRVNVNLGKKQRFGSQVEYNELGQAIAKNGIVDSVDIDRLREDYDLEPLKEYYNRFTTAHFEMNKSNMLERGIEAPNLYE